MPVHKNSHKNLLDHHLYAIIDSEQEDIFKYGISCEKLEKDGSSPRAKRQLKLFNRLAGWLRYYAKVLLTKIPGRKRAEEIEEEYILQYKEEKGFRPPGNPPKGRN